MLVRLYHVFVPHAFSKTFTVPRYWIPLIRAAWPDKTLVPGQEIKIEPLNEFKDADPRQEFEQIVNDFAAKDETDRPMWQAQFRSADDVASKIQAEYREYMQEKIRAEQERANAENQAAEATRLASEKAALNAERIELEKARAELAELKAQREKPARTKPKSSNNRKPGRPKQVSVPESAPTEPAAV